MKPVPAGAPILTAAAMRAAEERAFAGGTSRAILTERAGTAVAREVARFAQSQPILVLAGPGNNGGDAHVAARLLRDWGHDVNVAALGRLGGIAGDMAQLWAGKTVTFDAATPRPILVDGLFGTGLARPLSGAVVTQLAELRAGAGFCIAIDVPSGMDADGGGELGPSAADLTVALGALKPAHVLSPSAERCGHVVLADLDIAVPSRWTSIDRPRLTPPTSASHKYSRGMVVVIGGAMPGAARLAARAALHGGAGYVLLAGATGGTPDAIVHRSLDEAEDLERIFADERVGAVLIGPGLGRDDAARRMLDAALASSHALVLDGDALTLLGEDVAARLRGRSAATFLTPHGGEFDRIMAPDGANKIDRTLAAAERIGATIVHKGADTVVAAPDGHMMVSPRGPAWLSTAGTGDVLAGLVAARVAAGGAGAAAAEAVWLHARAAELAGAAFSADDLIPYIPQAIAECL